MNIYLIVQPNIQKSLEKLLSPYGKAIFLHKDTKSIEEYTELLENEDPKILAIAPTLVDWSIPNEFIAKIPNLKGIVTKSSWGNYIDINFCKENNIAVGRSPGANSKSVAEYAIWQMFSLFRKAQLQIQNNFEVGITDESIGTETTNKTIGILGMGRIGIIIANIAKGMGMNVIYWNRIKKDVGFEYREINDVLENSNVVFKCWETCDETKGLLNSDNLKLLKQDSYFISVFGGIGFSGEDDYILLDYAEKGRISGFSIENEHHKDAKVKDNYAGNVFIPAALAWHTKETHVKYNKIFTDTIIGIIEDKEVNRLT